MAEFSKLLNKRELGDLSPLPAEPTFSFIMTFLKPRGKLDGFTALSTQIDDRT
jgi:hypothetical protein